MVIRINSNLRDIRQKVSHAISDRLSQGCENIHVFP